MSRPYEGAPTCEGCASIGVRVWHRQDLLHLGQTFSRSWSEAGQGGSIGVRTEPGAVVLSFRGYDWGDGEWKSVNQRVPIGWTVCHFGGHRPWFCCPCCGRRVAKVFLGGNASFACRHCYGLGYESQLEPVGFRGLGRARKIRMRLGAAPDLFGPFPGRPKGMHWASYHRLRHLYDVAIS